MSDNDSIVECHTAKKKLQAKKGDFFPSITFYMEMLRELQETYTAVPLQAQILLPGLSHVLLQV